MIMTAHTGRSLGTTAAFPTSTHVIPKQQANFTVIQTLEKEGCIIFRIVCVSIVKMQAHFLCFLKLMC
jgi:hypothetical protein